MEEHLLSTLPEQSCEVINEAAFHDRIHWDEPDETFTLNDTEYDMVKTKTVSGKKYLYCIKENTELEMMGDISLKFHRSDDFKGHTFNLVFSGHYFPEKMICCNTNPDSVFARSFPFYSTDLSDTRKGILVPPPRTLS